MSFPLNYIRQDLLTAQTVDETTGPPVQVLGYKFVTIFFKRSAAITGVVTIEEADFNPTTESDYSGTWSPVVAFDVSTMTTDQVAYHLPEVSYSQIRARISTVVAGGNVTATLVAAS